MIYGGTLLSPYRSASSLYNLVNGIIIHLSFKSSYWVLCPVSHLPSPYTYTHTETHTYIYIYGFITFYILNNANFIGFPQPNKLVPNFRHVRTTCQNQILICSTMWLSQNLYDIFQIKWMDCNSPSKVCDVFPLFLF